MAGKHDIRFLFFEGLMVVFSVLAALLVDEWRQDLQTRHAVAAATEALSREVRHNLRELIDLDSVAKARGGRLQTLDPAKERGRSLASLTARFGGFRTPELSSAAWVRMSTGSLADHVPPKLMTDAFDLYSWNTFFATLDQQIQRLVYGEAFNDPTRTAVAQAIAERIINQQIVWAESARPRFEAFLKAHAPTGTDAPAGDGDGRSP